MWAGKSKRPRNKERKRQQNSFVRKTDKKVKRRDINRQKYNTLKQDMLQHNKKMDRKDRARKFRGQLTWPSQDDRELVGL